MPQPPSPPVDVLAFWWCAEALIGLSGRAIWSRLTGSCVKSAVVHGGVGSERNVQRSRIASSLHATCTNILWAFLLSAPQEAGQMTRVSRSGLVSPTAPQVTCVEPCNGTWSTTWHHVRWWWFWWRRKESDSALQWRWHTLGWKLQHRIQYCPPLKARESLISWKSECCCRKTTVQNEDFYLCEAALFSSPLAPLWFVVTLLLGLLSQWFIQTTQSNKRLAEGRF